MSFVDQFFYGLLKIGKIPNMELGMFKRSRNSNFQKDNQGPLTTAAYPLSIMRVVNVYAVVVNGS